MSDPTGDARHLSPSAQEALRLRAVAALVAGRDRGHVAAVFAVSLKAVDIWWTKWQAGGHTKENTLPDVSSARIADQSGQHVFIWAAPSAGFAELLAVWNRMDGMTAQPFTFAEPDIVTAAQDWLADKLQEHDKATVMVGSIEKGKWVNWNIPAVLRPALPMD